jgi:tetratricopeptide (TPR) repeat protein
MPMSPQDTDGRAAFMTACDHDLHGREAEAIPHYERALALGLPPDDRRAALLGLGSSLRNLDRHAEAVTTLRRAVEEFPGDPALPAFLALALYSAGDARGAVVQLLDLAIRHAPVGQYARSLSEYRDALRRPTEA